MTYSKIIGCGSYLPKKRILNSELPAELGTNDEWIRTRTGITQRYIAADGELTSDLAVAAAKVALKNAGLAEVDAIILATTSPDNTFPATAAQVQKKLGFKSGFAFDVQAVCAGFAFAVATADNFIKLGQIKTALVIGAETLTRVLDWSDRGTCVLFGDGAGAIVLSASDKPGIISTKLNTDGSHYDELYVSGGVSQKSIGVLKMNGREVFKHAVEKMSGGIADILASNGKTINDVNWIVPHQANLRIMNAIAERIGIAPEKVIETVSKHANTSAASIPLALCEAQSKFKKDDLIVLTALGGGFSWGSVLLKWS